MTTKGDPNVLRLVVAFLRRFAKLKQSELSAVSGVAQGSLSRYESGLEVPSDANLRRLAAAVGVSWPMVDELRRFTAAWVDAVAQGTEVELGLEEPLDPVILEPVRLAVRAYLVEDAAATAAGRQTPEEARREAEQVWPALQPLPASQRRRLLGLTLRASRNWALAITLCFESEKAAAHNPEEARELANLALFIAEQVEGEEGWRLQGFVWAHVANARRVANDHAGADAAFARAWELWRAGVPFVPELRAEWRLLDLEASLRRGERRFPEALALLDRALETGHGEPVAAARILLKKESVLEQMGNAEGALAVLAEAAPFVEASGDPRNLFALRFKTAKNLCHLERHEEAAALLPQVRELAAGLGNELDLIRVVWLEARVAAGHGKREAAVAGLEQVRKAFLDREMPYDAALSLLDLSVLHLEARRTGEVKALALEMMPIFQAHGIGREALAALKLFCDAAQQETATVELARRVMAEIETAKGAKGLP